MLNGRRDVRAKEESSSSSSLCRKKSIEIRIAVTVCLFSYRTEEQYYPLSACLVVAVATRFVLMTFEVCYCCWLRGWYFRQLSFLSLDSRHQDITRFSTPRLHPVNHQPAAACRCSHVVARKSWIKDGHES
jgi:hypothetical protein